MTGLPNDGSLTGDMIDPAPLDIFIRGGATSALLAIAVVFARRRPVGRKDVSVVALCLGVCAYLLVSTPSIDIGDGAVRAALIAVAGAAPALLYWAAMELFSDELELHWLRVALMASVVAASWVAQAGVPIGAVRGLGVICLFLHLLFVVATGASGDLIEARRRFRRWFLICTALLVLLITAIETTGIDRDLPDWAFVAHALAFFALAASFLIWAVGADPKIWGAPARAAPDAPPPPGPQAALIERVEMAMSEGLWRQEGLTVAALARHLGSQDHRIRSAINQGLGHRNFASYVNGFRVEAAKEMLIDPALPDRTVLSIAYEVGFASLGPFNRAFRARTGMSPTEFRKK